MSEMIIKPIYIDRLEGRGFKEEAIPPKWTDRAWTAECDKISKDKGQYGFFKFSKNAEHVSELYDLVYGSIGDECVYCYPGGWNGTSQAGLERLKVLFRVLQLDEYLELRENPLWATVPEERDVLAGVRVDRTKSNASISEQDLYNAQGKYLGKLNIK